MADIITASEQSALDHIAKTTAERATRAGVVFDLINAAVKQEREECAKIALAIDGGLGNEKGIARAIRARGAMPEACR